MIKIGGMTEKLLGTYIYIYKWVSFFKSLEGCVGTQLECLARLRFLLLEYMV